MGSGTGTIWGYSSYGPYVYKDYPSTGTMRIRSRGNLGGTYRPTTNPAGAFATIDALDMILLLEAVMKLQLFLTALAQPI